MPDEPRLPTVIARSVRPFAACRAHGAGRWSFHWIFAADDPAFAGHFPGHPVLPGAFLLEMACRAAEHALGEAWYIDTVPHLRFISPVLPGNGCTLHLRWSVPTSIELRFETDTGPVAYGRLQAASRSERVAIPAHDWARSAPRRPLSAAALDVLPHAHPMLLVDCVCRTRSPEEPVVAYKNISINEPCYAGVPPGLGPRALAYPLGLMVESFAQSAGILLAQLGLLGRSPDNTTLLVFGEFRGIHLYADAFPGDRLRHDLRVTEAGRTLVRLGGETSVDGRLIARFDSLMAFSVAAAALSRSEQLA